MRYTQRQFVLTPGERIGAYEITAAIGAGGMGVVYRAKDRRLGRPVAIRFLRAETGPAGSSDRLLLEARAASALNHPHICTVYDVGHHDGGAYLVMEFLEGETLAERFRRGRLPPTLAVDLAVNVADALDAAHRRGIIHRDVKPANVFVTTRQQAKVLDFGVAKRTSGADAEQTRYSVTSDGLSPDGRMFSTSTGHQRGLSDDRCPGRFRNQPHGAAHRGVVSRGRHSAHHERSHRLPVAQAAGDESWLSAVARERRSSVWVEVSAGADSYRRVQGNRDDGAEALTWTNDGRLVFSDSSSIGWVMDADGSNRASLTERKDPAWATTACGTGPLVAYTAPQSGKLRMFLLDPAHVSGAREVTTFSTPARSVRGYPSCTPDSRWIVYTNGRDVERVPAEGGTPTTVVARAHHPELSPDGKLLACHKETGDGERWQIYSTADWTLVRSIPQPFPELSVSHWAPDGRSIVGIIARDVNENLWRIDLATAVQTQVSHFTDANLIFGFGFSRDGRVAVARGENVADVVLIRRP